MQQQVAWLAVEEGAAVASGELFDLAFKTAYRMAGRRNIKNTSKSSAGIGIARSTRNFGPRVGFGVNIFIKII